MMIPDSHLPRRDFLMRLVGGWFTIALSLLGTGCGPGMAPKTVPTTSPARSGDSLEAVREAFKKQLGTHSYRSALQQLNTTFGSQPDQKPAPLTDAQRQLDVKDIGLENDELAEVSNLTFTALDAHYLDQCFLLRDAVRSFDLPDLNALQRAKNAFAWVVRQVRLQEKDAEPLPPLIVLRRGWGTSLERSYLYLAVLHQMGLECCLITYPVEASGQGISRYWIPGVLVEKKIYLFDTRLGMPLPDPDPKGKGIATLAQVRSPKGYFDRFTIDPKDDRHRYDITPEQAGRTEILLTWPLSALAPRMTYLENLLASMNNKVRLSADPAGMRQRFEEAAQEHKLPVRLNNRRGDYTYTTPLQVLRHFLPPSEGGIDQNPPGRTRLFLAEFELTPWRALPQEIFGPPYSEANLVKGLRYAFGELFAQFPLPPPRNLQLQKDHSPVGIGKDPEKNQSNVQERFEQYLRDPVVPYLAVTGTQTLLDQLSVHHSLKSNSPRDDLLRGRWDEATTKLVEVVDQVRFQKSRFQSEPDLAAKMRRWFEDAVAAQAELQKAVRGEGDLDRVRLKLTVLWLGDVKPAPAEIDETGKPQPSRPASHRNPPWLTFVLGLAADPMGAEATYLLALTKHEKAERAQARLDALPGSQHPDRIKDCREAWETAANWWKRYLEEYPTGSGAAAARLGYARTLEALHQPDQARELLRNLTGNLSPLDETARLYRAKALK
jgi:hypothetical protein